MISEYQTILTWFAQLKKDVGVELNKINNSRTLEALQEAEIDIEGVEGLKAIDFADVITEQKGKIERGDLPELKS